MSDQLARIIDRLDEVRERTIRIEEKQNSVEHSRRSLQMSVNGLSDKIREFVPRSEANERENIQDTKHDALTIRVVRLEEAQDIFETIANKAAVKSGSIGVGIGTGVAAGIWAAFELFLKKHSG